MNIDDYRVFQASYRPTPMGDVLYVQIGRKDEGVMPYLELHGVFAAMYPGKWALQVLPPDDCHINQVNLYHIFVLEEMPEHMNLARKSANYRTPDVRFPLEEDAS